MFIYWRPRRLEGCMKKEVHAAGLKCPCYIHRVPLANLAFALNLGVERSEGEFIARMDSDDRCGDERFEAQVCFLQSHLRCCVVGLKTVLIDEKSEVIRGHRFPFFASDREIRAALRRKNPMCHPGVMFRRGPLEAVGGYGSGNSAEDHELYLRLARDRNNLFANLREPLFSAGVIVGS